MTVIQTGLESASGGAGYLEQFDQLKTVQVVMSCS